MKVICPKCKLETNHEVLASFKEGSAPEDKYDWSASYEVIRCAGCATVSFRKETWCEDDFDPYTGRPDPSETLFPSRTAGRDPIPTHSLHLPPKIDRIYTEVIEALNQSLPVLAGVGLRTLIEAICNDQKATGKDLQKKIDALATSGVLAKKQSEMLHSHRFLGNLAAHEVEAAHPRELIAALEIAETMIKTLYVLPHLEASIVTGKKPRSTPTQVPPSPHPITPPPTPGTIP